MGIELENQCSYLQMVRLRWLLIHSVVTFSISQAPVNDNLMEILIVVDAKRASAETISVVMPYYGWLS